MYLDDNEEGGQICTLDNTFLSSFRVNDSLTVTVKAKGGASKTVQAKVTKVKGTEEYITTDYDSPVSKNGSRKKITKTRPGCVEFTIGKSVPSGMDLMCCEDD